MHIIDTVVLLAFLDEDDPRFRKANHYVLEISRESELFVPSEVLFELDLELKSHGLTEDERNEIHSRMSRLIPVKKVMPTTPAALARASQLAKSAKWRGAYFDTIIVATGLENSADSAISTDRRFVQLGLKTTF